MEATETLDVQAQINAINKKLDIVLEEIYIQKQKRQEVEDLVTDLSIIGNDMFKASVYELDHAGVELDSEALKSLFFRLLRNVGTLNDMVEMIESATDLAKEAAPIIHQMGLQGISQMNELEKKGYFDFIKELFKIADNIIEHFSADDDGLLADNIVTILETIKNLTQPEMLDAMNNAVNVFKKIETRDIPEYSLWKAFKEMRSPEMKKGIGFMITFLKNIAEDNKTASADNK
ncbi:MAG: DUF1641 domain-containing protein [Cyclobacteriaceae bacterium]|nr:DUF1641 domain-containing protein [Cyclobacteriaceae bacterium]